MGVNGIYGLSGSGLDIESMVKVGMMSRQNEYDKMAQKFTLNEWKKTAYLDISSQITTFNLSTLSDYKMSSSMNAKTADSSDTSAVRVTANASAMNMSHIVSVESLSSNAYLISTGSIAATDPDDSTKTSIKLKDILFDSLEYGDSSTEEAQTVTGQILNTPDRSFKNISVETKAMSFFIGDGTKGEDGNPVSKEVSFTYKEIMNGVTLNDLTSKINDLGLNIKASYDTLNDRFSLYNTKGGSENTISIKTAASNTDSETGEKGWEAAVGLRFLNSIRLYQSKAGTLVSPQDNSKTYADVQNKGLYFNKLNTGATSGDVTGIDGKIYVDGVEYKTTDNKITVGGITYNALNETTNNVTVTVSQNTDAIVDKVKSFVESYNKILSSLYEKYDEKGDSNYKPLTQSQKDAMKDEQIEKWEEKAKAGLLYHDSTLGKIINDMRSAISQPVEGVSGDYTSAYSIGISTTGIKGQLVLDETKLKNALAADSDSVYNVFAKLNSDATTDASTGVVKENGIAQRLGDIFTTATKSIKSRAGSSADITEDSDLNNLLRELQTKMSNFKKLMSSFEDRLYKRYDAMEVALASLGMQMNYVTGAFS